MFKVLQFEDLKGSFTQKRKVYNDLLTLKAGLYDFLHAKILSKLFYILSWVYKLYNGLQLVCFFFFNFPRISSHGSGG